MTGDMYPRPDRDAIAARVRAETPGAPPVLGMPSAMTAFSTHLAARMRVLAWDQASLQDRAGISAHIAGRAINGTAVDLALAEKLAHLVGMNLTDMLGPYQCRTCDGKPPAGFACLECGTEGERL